MSSSPIIVDWLCLQLHSFTNTLPVRDWWWRWRRNVSFSLSSCLSLFSAFTLFSRARNRSLYSLWKCVWAPKSCFPPWRATCTCLSHLYPSHSFSIYPGSCVVWWCICLTHISLQPAVKLGVAKSTKRCPFQLVKCFTVQCLLPIGQARSCGWERSTLHSQRHDSHFELWHQFTSKWSWRFIQHSCLDFLFCYII